MREEEAVIGSVIFIQHRLSWCGFDRGDRGRGVEIAERRRLSGRRVEKER
jgi:hypothetical protein